MNWEDFDAFCHVVDDGGFTAAARALNWPKSRVSAAVARLEAELSRRLLERTTRRVSLTAEGEDLYRKAAPVFQKLRELRDETVASVETVSGKLRIAAPYEFSVNHLGPVMYAILTRYPALEIDIDMHYDPVDLAEGRYDMVFTAIEGVLPDSDLVARRIFFLQRSLFASPGFIAQHGMPQVPANISSLPVIASHDDTEWLFHDAKGATCSSTLRPRLRSPNAALRLHAAIAGLGIARITASYCADAIKDGRLQAVLPDFECDPLRMYALLPGRQHLPARARVFLQALVDT